MYKTRKQWFEVLHYSCCFLFENTQMRVCVQAQKQGLVSTVCYNGNTGLSSLVDYWPQSVVLYLGHCFGGSHALWLYLCDSFWLLTLLKRLQQVEGGKPNPAQWTELHVLHSCLIFMATWLVNHTKEHNDDNCVFSPNGLSFMWPPLTVSKHQAAAPLNPEFGRNWLPTD